MEPYDAGTVSTVRYKVTVPGDIEEETRTLPGGSLSNVLSFGMPSLSCSHPSLHSPLDSGQPVDLYLLDERRSRLLTRCVLNGRQRHALLEPLKGDSTACRRLNKSGKCDPRAEKQSSPPLWRRRSLTIHWTMIQWY